MSAQRSAPDMSQARARAAASEPAGVICPAPSAAWAAGSACPAAWGAACRRSACPWSCRLRLRQLVAETFDVLASEQERAVRTDRQLVRGGDLAELDPAGQGAAVDATKELACLSGGQVTIECHGA